MAAAARTQTIVVAQPQQRRGQVARRRTGGRRRSAHKGASPGRVRERCISQGLAYGGLSALAFGFLQRKVKLPGITGIPNSLTYGSLAAITAVIVKSPKLLQASAGPLYAGLHNVGLHGVEGDSVAGEFDDQTAGEFDQQEVTAGEFDDL